MPERIYLATRNDLDGHIQDMYNTIMVMNGSGEAVEKAAKSTVDAHLADTTKHKTGDGLTDLKVKNTDTEVYYYLRIDNDGLYLVEV